MTEHAQTPTPLPGPGDGAPARPASGELLGVPLALANYAGVLEWIDAAVAARSSEYVCVAATHTVVACGEDPELRAAVLGASMTVPDGQPLVWALRALGRGDGLDGRVYGPELMARACERGARTGLRMFLYGGRNQGALVQLTANLRARYPGVQIVGGYVPPFRPLTEAEEDAVTAEIERCGADVVWVGIGVPKQEKWMAHMRPRLAAPVLIGVGAAFDFHAGLVAQAPGWIQSAGLEWAYRLAREPRRLWRRYLRYNPRFVIGFVREYAAQRASLRR
jgi:N-acetylglucosaminyldiphosphoundecaprenol N-acetyl-beta-D-mannosaminyltransferase